MKQDHGVPALLSFFFPGLGQLVKRQYENAVLIWVLILLPWLLWLLGAIALIPGAKHIILYDPERISPVLLSPVLPFILLLNLIVYLWSVVDAYNRPV